LVTLVGTGGYEVRIPEDAVLLVVAHLALSGDRAGALELLENVRPFIDAQRFMPRYGPSRPGQPSPRAIAVSSRSRPVAAVLIK
jgi:hypothetical protein